MYKTTKYFDSNNFWGRPLNLYGRFQGLIPTTHPHRIMYHPKLCETDSEWTQDEGAVAEMFGGDQAAEAVGQRMQVSRFRLTVPSPPRTAASPSLLPPPAPRSSITPSLSISLSRWLIITSAYDENVANPRIQPNTSTILCLLLQYRSSLHVVRPVLALDLHTSTFSYRLYNHHDAAFKAPKSNRYNFG